MSKSQKYIKIISIIDIILGIIGLVVGILGAVGGFVVAGGGTGAEVAATDAAGFGVGMVLTAIASIITIIVGILGLRAAKDASKIKPVFVIAIISLVITVISVIGGLVGGKFDTADLFSLVGDVLMVFCANNVRKQAQEQARN